MDIKPKSLLAALTAAAAVVLITIFSLWRQGYRTSAFVVEGMQGRLMFVIPADATGDPIHFLRYANTPRRAFMDEVVMQRRAVNPVFVSREREYFDIVSEDRIEYFYLGTDDGSAWAISRHSMPVSDEPVRITGHSGEVFLVDQGKVTAILSAARAEYEKAGNSE